MFSRRKTSLVFYDLQESAQLSKRREGGSLVFNDLQERESAQLSKRKRKRLTCVPREEEAHLCLMINKRAHNFPRERGSFVFNDLQESALLSKRKRRRLTCVPREGSLVFQEKEAHLYSKRRRLTCV